MRRLRDFTGLWYTRPALAGLMTVFLLSLGGMPTDGRVRQQVVHLQRRCARGTTTLP
jgi:hypothetical protein